MYLYRAMTNTELINRINGIETNEPITKSKNTFTYKDNIDYIHFYKYAAHAFYLRDMFSMACVAKIEVADELIPQLEYGLYNRVETYYDDSLSEYHIPLPEIILERNLVKNKHFIDFSNTLTGNFDESQFFQQQFWTSQKRIFQKEERQLWSITSIYYEYIKILLPKFNYDTLELANYLKTINLYDELNIMSEKIQQNNILTKRTKTRANYRLYYKK